MVIENSIIETAAMLDVIETFNNIPRSQSVTIYSSGAMNIRFGCILECWKCIAQALVLCLIYVYVTLQAKTSLVCT